ncbi:MAG TPA: amidohydrolase family protein, partial [Blastocatellia bacterium]|nr:amidohydrolase family protein [Blastocatellia bacterium]
VKTAREVGIPFAGHIPNAVGLAGALKAKQSTIEHLDGYIELLEADDSPVKTADPQTRAKELHKYLDERKIAALATATRDAGVWTVPTMILYANIFSRETAEALRGREEMKYIPPQMLNQWSENRKGQLANMDPEVGRRLADIRKKILKGLQEAGAKIMLGTDAPQLWNVPGFSIHREMQVMSEAGLTPYQILESGTRNVAVYLNTLAESGTVEVGKRADLILLERNPLESVANVSRRAGVMLRGRWLAESELRRMLDQIAARYKVV